MSVTACRTVPTRPVAAPWLPDHGDGTYRNPILYADWSDPDVVRVGDDYYLTASSFDARAGLPDPALPGPGQLDARRTTRSSSSPADALRTSRATAAASGRRRSATTTAGSGSSGAIPTTAST